MQQLPGGNLKCLVYYRERLQLGFLVARTNGEELHGQLVNLMKETGLGAHRIRLAAIPLVPICAVVLAPQMTYAPSLPWLGDFERCAAIAWFREEDAAH